MSWVATAVVGSTVVGGYLSSKSQSDAASQASGAQQASSAASIAEQRRQFEALKQILSPYSSAAVGGGGSNTQAIIGYYQKYMGTTPKQETLDSWLDDINSGKRTLADTERIISSGPGAQAYALGGNLTPPPQGSLEAQQDLLGLRGTQAQGTAIGNIESSPMFDSLYRQGENALLQNASATGGLRGGNIQGALAQFRPALLQSLIDQQYSRLSGITALGQNAAAGQGNAGMQTGQNISSALQQSGAAQAGNYLAQGQAKSNMYNLLPQAVGTYYGIKGF